MSDRIDDLWIQDGRAARLPDVLSLELDAYLNRLPWLGSALDWSKMPPSRTFNSAGKPCRCILRRGIACHPADCSDQLVGSPAIVILISLGQFSTKQYFDVIFPVTYNFLPAAALVLRKYRRA